MNAADWAKRLAALVLAAAVVVSVAGAGAVLAERSQEAPAEPLDTPEYAPSNVDVDYLQASGQIQVNRSAATGDGTVVIDKGHGNRFSQADIQPMVEALTRVGYDVEFYTGGDLAAQLEDAKAFVVIDPSQEFEPGDVDDVRRFTGQGGHLLLVGEPTQITVGGGLFGTGIRTQQPRLTTLTTPYGMTVDTAYLYNQENADANYKWITARPTDAEGLDGIERTTMYTAAEVTVNGGTVLLRSSPNTLKSSTDDQSGQYPVAVRKREVVLVGDSTFLTEGRYRVADNEAFAAYLVRFLASSDRTPGTDISGADEETGTDGPTPGGNDTSTTVDID
ncbi:MAG: DUF4350 domain-containing protein [Haloferacaceae archaeon]